MKRHYVYISISILLVLVTRVKGQEIELVDSLIDKSVMPIMASEKWNNPWRTNDTQTSLYYFKLAGSNSNRIIRYVLIDEDSVYKHPKNTHKEKYDSTIRVPVIHPVFFNTETNVDHNVVKNFAINHYLKNAGDSTWRMEDLSLKLRIFSKNNIVDSMLFVARKYNLSEKSKYFQSTTIHDINLKGYVKPWSHLTPNLFHYSLEYVNRCTQINETFSERIGFRQVRVIDNKLYVNKREIVLKSTKLQIPTPFDRDSLYHCLRKLRVNNFNTIILTARGDKELFHFCDSIGLYVIQEIRRETFATLSDLLNYFTMFKGSPSFIAWNNISAPQIWTNVLSRLDPYRPMAKGTLFSGIVVDDWWNKDQIEKDEIKICFQPFRFVFNRTNSLIQVILDEPFESLDRLELQWTLLGSDGKVETGSATNIKFKKNLGEVTIARSPIWYEENLQLQLKLVPSVEWFPFDKNDVIATETINITNKR